MSLLVPWSESHGEDNLLHRSFPGIFHVPLACGSFQPLADASQKPESCNSSLLNLPITYSGPENKIDD